MIRQSSTQLHDTLSHCYAGQQEHPAALQQMETQMYYLGRTEALIAEVHHPKRGRTDLRKVIRATQGSRSLGKTIGKRQVPTPSCEQKSGSGLVMMSMAQWSFCKHIVMREIWGESEKSVPGISIRTNGIHGQAQTELNWNISFHCKEENPLIARWRLFVFLNLTTSPNEQGWYLFQHGAGKRTQIARKSKWLLKFIYLSAF